MLEKAARHQKRLAALRAFHRNHGRLPSARELIALLDLASPRSATRIMRTALASGHLERAGRHYRPTSRLTGLPCFSSVSAGFPSPAEDETCDIISLDEYLIPNHDAAFLVRVTGDSMTGAGIMPGDIIIVERGATPRNGEIVVARIDGEWTLKHYRRRGSSVILESANPRYPDLTPRGELVIGGVVRGSVRRYGPK